MPNTDNKINISNAWKAMDAIPIGLSSDFKTASEAYINIGNTWKQWWQQAQGTTWLGTWAKRRKITISSTNVDTDLTHYPHPIILGTSVGIGNTNVSDIFDEVGANSQKIAVTDSAGNQLYVEVAHWDETTESGVLWVSRSDWTISSSTDTDVYVYFDSTEPDNTTYVDVTASGSAINVWDSGFAGVWHLGEQVTPTASGGIHYDSTGINDGTQSNDASLDITSTVTLSAWVRRDGASAAYAGLIGKADWTTNDRAYFLAYRTDASGFYCEISDDGLVNLLNSNFSATDGIWYHVAVGVDGSNNHIYVNGDLKNSQVHTTGINSTTVDFSIGHYDSIQYWNGGIDEGRVSSVGRSSAWVKADYYSQDDNILTWSDTEYNPPITILLSDDFNRTDSNTVGNGWTETDGEAGAEASITSNRLSLVSANNTNQPMVSYTFTKQTSGKIEWSFVVNFSRTGVEGGYYMRMQLGDSASLGASPDTGVAVSLVWQDPGAEGSIDHEGFSYTTAPATITQIGVVSGPGGLNDGGDATVTVVADLDTNTYDITITGTGLISGTGSATAVAFLNNVDIDTVRFYTDALDTANFDEHEFDDVLIRTV